MLLLIIVIEENMGWDLLEEWVSFDTSYHENKSKYHLEHVR